MVSIEMTGDMLGEIADELPEEFYKYLNGGIILKPEYKIHPQSNENEICIMAEYCFDNLGRYILFYYGSFEKVYYNLPPELFREKLRETLIHEFTHHIESLAGEYGLEIKDEKNIARYRQGYKP